ncbi:hypothetical protein GH714_022221 [Hevea brasiliensis]|uniref:Integrase catalytic domain-containing protein n=1 Tax=Hevea brasiliensis TaxID=3981 RepID=A0A6A6KT95_HEVBR|nr:hypothetical protein GH714_022221 [Hevea brasiliensis]
MGDDIQLFVKMCLVCQQDKTEQRRPARLLEPLPIPSHPWESVSMDFIVGLPKVGGLGNIMVIVGRLSKYAVFMPTPALFDAKEAAKLFFHGVVKYWGLPRDIMSDRDVRFTGRFWTELFRIMGTDLRFSTSFHPQTDEQMERINALLELYLPHFVSANQRDWLELLDVAQFSYNLQKRDSGRLMGPVWQAHGATKGTRDTSEIHGHLVEGTRPGVAQSLGEG